jgi:ketosteroid isomerase-like protein
MTPGNVDVVRAVVSAFNRGDYAAAIELCAEDVEFDWSRRMLDGEVFQGHEGVRRFMQTVFEIFDEIEIPSEDLTDLGGGLVLLAGTARFKGHASGLDVKAAAANLWTVRDGKVARFCFYQSKEDALADV